MSGDNAVKLVVLICEEALEHVILPEILGAGAKGYTVCDARGSGSHGVRDARWMSSNVRIETLCSEPVARRILEIVETRYSENYALVIYTHDVAVIRGRKF